MLKVKRFRLEIPSTGRSLNEAGKKNFTSLMSEPDYKIAGGNGLQTAILREEGIITCGKMERW